MRSCCSAVPNSNRLGARRKIPFWATRWGSPARKYSSSKISHSHRLASRPPYSRGHDTTAQPASNSFRSHSRWAPIPAAVSPDGMGSGGLLASSQSRTSARKASSSTVHPISIPKPPRATILYPGYALG